MTLCKLFSARLLHAPWVLHLDVFRPQLNPVLTGRSRPDLVGPTNSGDWVAFECKGRVSPPSADAKDKAKEQAERLITINGVPPRFHVGCIMYFRNDVLQFFWRDPEPNARQRKTPIKVEPEEGIWRFYYLPVFELIRAQPEQFEKMLRERVLMSVEQVNVEVGIYPLILKLLAREQWDDAIQSCRELAKELKEADYRADGIRVVAGRTWLFPFKEFDI
jgi:hypothetical protein